MGTRPAIFKWRQTEPGLILCAVRWYLRYSLSLRDVEELLEERGLDVDHTTVWRWVQDYGPELEQRLRQHLKPTNKSWRVDETYVRVKGRWCYLYRAIDSTGCGSSKLNAAEFRCWRPFLGQQRFVWRGLRTALSIPETRKRACLPRSRRESPSDPGGG